MPLPALRVRPSFAPVRHAGGSAIVAALAVLAGCGGGGGGGASGGNQEPGSPPPSTAFAGTVTRGGSPLPDVTIVAYNTNTNTVSGTATTDATGHYSFTGLGASCTDNCVWNYQFFASKTGYTFAPHGAGAAGPAAAGYTWNAPAWDWSTASGAAVSREGYNGAFTNPGGGAGIVFTVWNFDSAVGNSFSAGDFDAFDGSTGRVQLAASGQTRSYIAGDDAAVHAGVAWPATRYVDHHDGTITDTLTGLVWLKDAGCLAPALWNTALQTVGQLASGQCGLSDGSAAGQWRLPNVWELESVVDESATGPALTPGNPFANVGGGGYWTSTSYYGGETGSPAAWAIRMSDGRYLNDASANIKTVNALGVWAVRDGVVAGAVQLQATGMYVPYATGDDGTVQSGVASPFPRMRVNGDGTVTDTLTGLVWLQQANCISGNWNAAVAAVRALGSGQCGLSDGSQPGSWHLPNRKEMESLGDRAQNNQADFLDTSWNSAIAAIPSMAAVFDQFIGFQYYWTSTTDAADPTQAWTVFSCDYGVYEQPKTVTGYALAVR